MKTLAELKQLTFIPHHECGCCGSMVGWHIYDGSPWFDSSCDCGCSPDRLDSWENVFRWYNSAFEHESDDAIQSEWARSNVIGELKEIMLVNSVSGERISSGTYKKQDVDEVIAKYKARISELESMLSSVTGVTI